jgi:hypothetical protein
MEGLQVTGQIVFSSGTGLDLHHEQDVQAPEEHGVNVQEVARQDPGYLGGQELPSGR